MPWLVAAGGLPLSAFQCGAALVSGARHRRAMPGHATGHGSPAVGSCLEPLYLTAIPFHSVSSMSEEST